MKESITHGLFFWRGVSFITLKVADSRGIVKDTPKKNHVDQAKTLRLETHSIQGHHG